MYVAPSSRIIKFLSYLFYSSRTVVPFAKNSLPNGMQLLIDVEAYDYAVSTTGSEGLIVSVLHQVSISATSLCNGCTRNPYHYKKTFLCYQASEKQPLLIFQNCGRCLQLVVIKIKPLFYSWLVRVDCCSCLTVMKPSLFSVRGPML